MNIAQKSQMTLKQATQVHTNESFDVSLTAEERQLLLGDDNYTTNISVRLSSKVRRILERCILMMG